MRLKLFQFNKPFRNKKVKGGALQYVLVISVIVALLIFSFISIIYLQKRIAIKNTLYKESIQNVTNSFFSDLEISTDNLQENNTIRKKDWGVFQYAIVSSTINNESFSRIGLLGEQNSKRTTLYLEENNKPLAVVGNTKITGKCYLPKQGVKRGNISGTSYYGDNLIYGTSTLSKKQLPIIKNKSSFNRWTDKSFLNDTIAFFELQDGLKLSNSFKTKTKVTGNQSSVQLQNVSLTGNIIIQASTKITVYASAVLKDVILVAPEIEIKSKVKGNFQVFATKKIIVNEGCELYYPSSLVLNSKSYSKEKESSEISILKNNDIRGIVVFTSESKKSNFEPQIKIEENTEIFGEVYCNKNLELLGKVFGSVFTHQFITKKKGSVYVNHLYDAEINGNKLPEEYCGLVFGKENIKVAKSLY